MSIPRSTANAPERRAATAILIVLAAAWVLSCLGRAENASEATQYAYIGPGAGIALLGSFFAVFSAFLSAVFFLISWPVRFVWRGIRGARPFGKAKAKRVVVLGLDGLEPTLTEAMIDAGKLPNLARLREQGTYTRLGTTTPPLSPVAWSSFTTGTNPGKHNIYDFISRNPASYRPTQSSVQVRDSGRKLRVGPYVIPLSRPDITGLRKSKPFWNVLGEKGIFSAIVRVPITFPPDRFRGVQLSAMCVPDLRGTHGMFSYYTENGQTGATTEGEVGGDVIAIERDGDAVHSFLRGPDNTLRAGQPQMRVPFRVTKGDNGSPTLHIDGQKVRLTPGRYTDWVSVRFRAVGLLKVRGVCRFMLKQFQPFEMYCTPVQIDPEKPIMPISNPGNYAKYLARLQGPYATLGLAEDTWSLSENRLDEDAFLTQAYDIHAEREAMFFDALKRVPRGCVVCVFDGPDRIQHMFWRFIDENHPALAGKDRASHKHVIEEMYQKMDDLVGRTMDEVDDRKTVLFVMSDHGFKPFRRGVDLNTWLLENGYLALKEGARRPSASYLADIDWSRTQAYALGLAGIFLNVRGREGQGTVERADAARVAAEISEKLTGLRDPQDNEVAIHEAMPKGTVYRGPYLDAAPDIIIGYTPGYRVSWDAVIGKCGEAVFSDNTKAWSGDHCIHPDLVPGVLFCNRKLNLDDPDIVDLAPTTLDLFGVEKPAYMDGKSLLCAETTN
jgi:predicted AlkP superfamily phosphohydrolase/phosphomutase